MKVLSSWLKQPLVLGLVTFLIAPIDAVAARPLPPVPQAAGTAPSNQTPSQTIDQGTKSTVAMTSLPTSSPDSPGTVLTQTTDQSQQTPAPQTTQTKQENSTPAPVGTAAAPYEKQEGVSASRPAGAAIAPGKQRRIRSFAIRAGLLVGAAIAIGVVTAATLSSPSRPH